MTRVALDALNEADLARPRGDETMDVERSSAALRTSKRTSTPGSPTTTQRNTTGGDQIVRVVAGVERMTLHIRSPVELRLRRSGRRMGRAYF